jgi:cbb3-type cytochrome oxidase maturation protein
MEVLFLLVCISVSVATIFLLLFIWSVKSGQYEDCHTPGMRILLDEKVVEVVEKEVKSKGESKL